MLFVKFDSDFVCITKNYVTVLKYLYMYLTSLYVVLLQRLSEGAQLNYEQNMHDAIAIMNKLQTGLDVNVKFTG